MGDWTIFSGNLRGSLWNDDLSKEPYFSQIHLAGQNFSWSFCSVFGSKDVPLQDYWFFIKMYIRHFIGKNVKKCFREIRI
jgi:hypothetical protein